MAKRIISTLCAVLMLFGLFALSATAATTSKLVPTNIPKSFSNVKQDANSTVVNFWHAMTGVNATYVDNIVNWYNAGQGKKKKIYVKSVFQGDYDAITIKIQAALQSGNIKMLPDLIQASSGAAFSIKESSRIIYMEDMMKSDSTFKIKDKLNKNAMWACSYKGKQLGMPFSNSMIMMHYNASAFKSVGLDPNNPPKTLAEYASAASKLVIKGKGSKPVRYGTTNKLILYQLSTMIPRQKKGLGYQFNNEDGRAGVPTKYTCDGDGTLKATLTEWKKVLDTGTVDYVTNTPRTNFFNGLTAMYMDSMVHYEATMLVFKTMSDKSKVFDYRMTRIPTVNADDSVGEAIGGSAVFMFEKDNATTKAATWDFVKFLCSVDVSAYWYVASGYYPLNDDAINTKYVQDVLTALPMKKVPLKVRADSAQDWRYQEPWIPGTVVYSNNVGDQIALMAQGKQNIDQTIASIAKKANSLLQVYANANS